MEIKRDQYLDKLVRKMNNGQIKVITGIRRCGKSYLLNNLFYNHLLKSGVDKQHIIKFAFDSFTDLGLIGESLNELDILSGKRLVKAQKFVKYVKERIKDQKKYYILLDEVQLLESFEYVLLSFLRANNLDIYVTGSNSKFLSSDVITEFAGWGDEIHVMPLVFSEFLPTFKGTKEEAFGAYQMLGGLPGLVKIENDEDKKDYLRHQMENVYIRDIINRYKISSDNDLKIILNVISSGMSSLTNPVKISSTFSSVMKEKISVSTVEKYIGYFEDSFLLRRVYRYDIKGRKYIGAPYKIYFEDIGLRNARLNFRQIEPTHIMENIVYNELRYRGCDVDVGVVVKKDKNKHGKEIKKQLEVDFVANHNSARYYIQSAYKMPTVYKINQEKMSLKNIDDSFRKIIIVNDNMGPSYDDNGFLKINIFDFLLNKHSLNL